jgi:ribosome production factor 1
MGFSKPPEHALKSAPKLKRKELYVQYKKASDKERRDMRYQRKKEEARNPELKAARLAKRTPKTLDQKRVWDEVDDDSLGVQVDLERLKKRRIEQAEEEERAELEAAEGQVDDDDDADSMLDSDEDDEEAMEKAREKRARRNDSIAPSTTSTNLDLAPASLTLKFPSLFNDLPPPTPKILVTTSLNSTIHHEAHMICTLFPNSNYVPRSSHRYGHKYSLREICKFASNRDYTAVGGGGGGRRGRRPRGGVGGGPGPRAPRRAGRTARRAPRLWRWTREKPARSTAGSRSPPMFPSPCTPRRARPRGGWMRSPAACAPGLRRWSGAMARLLL